MTKSCVTCSREVMLGFEVFGQGNAAKFSLCVRVTRPGSSRRPGPFFRRYNSVWLARPTSPTPSASACVVCLGPRPLFARTIYLTHIDCSPVPSTSSSPSEPSVWPRTASYHLYISTSSELPCRRSCRWRLRGSPPRGNPSCFLLSLPSRSRSRPLRKRALPAQRLSLSPYRA